MEFFKQRKFVKYRCYEKNMYEFQSGFFCFNFCFCITTHFPLRSIFHWTLGISLVYSTLAEAKLPNLCGVWTNSLLTWWVRLLAMTGPIIPGMVANVFVMPRRMPAYLWRQLCTGWSLCHTSSSFFQQTHRLPGCAPVSPSWGGILHPAAEKAAFQ